MTDSTFFGYSPGDRVILFDDTSIIRDDLAFDCGTFLRSPDGDVIRLTQMGRRAGGGTRGHHRIYHKAQQDKVARARRLGAARRDAAQSALHVSDRLRVLSFRQLREGVTAQTRVLALELIAELDKLDQLEFQESEHATRND